MSNGGATIAGSHRREDIDDMDSEAPVDGRDATQPGPRSALTFVALLQQSRKDIWFPVLFGIPLCIAMFN